MRAELRRPDETLVAYEVSGDGPPVLFLHGLTNSRRGWDPIVERLRGDYTCIRPDFRGHGESSSAPDYTLPSLVADTHAVAEELGLAAPAVVGHSLGGTAAAIYAAAHPARAVVCVDQGLRFGDFAERVLPYADQLRGDECMQAVIEIEHGLGLEPYDGVADLERRVLAFPPEVVRGLWAGLLTTPPEELTAVAEAVLPRIGAPLLALHGTPPPPDYEEWLTGLVPTAQVEVWDGTGHILHLVDPDRFAARVRAFLGR